MGKFILELPLAFKCYDNAIWILSLYLIGLLGAKKVPLWTLLHEFCLVVLLCQNIFLVVLLCQDIFFALSLVQTLYSAVHTLYYKNNNDLKSTIVWIRVNAPQGKPGLGIVLQLRRLPLTLLYWGLVGWIEELCTVVIVHCWTTLDYVCVALRPPWTTLDCTFIAVRLRWSTLFYVCMAAPRITWKETNWAKHLATINSLWKWHGAYYIQVERGLTGKM